MVFFSFFGIVRIRVIPTGVVSSLSTPQYCLSSDRCCHAPVSYHASFPLNQNEVTTSVLSSDNASSHRLPSRAETEALNMHHRHRLPSPNRLTHTLHCYKKIILTLTTLPTTQPRLHFVSSLAKAPCHQNSTCRRCSLSPSSHAHPPSTQRHPR
jgi:hypothetical protein